ncbi:MAG: tRNA (adenosine(37)-N6)-dimethylallyltransferase MiaA [Bacteroidetes bacterium]|nr:tRNA (adenosine(37)-N6)-dimethylallyltransferase MiaA [Bacteroidota bacterium]
MENCPLLICIVGPTCTGKTTLSLNLARSLGCDIVSADSRQFYREMNIGTAKPIPEERGDIMHHFIDFLSIHDSYSAGHFERDALPRLNEIFSVKRVVILVGGSGLYVQAVCHGFPPLPDTDKDIRNELDEILRKEGLKGWLTRLEKSDPGYYNTVDKNNTRRIQRALEVCMITGKKFSDLRAGKPAPRPFRIIKIGLAIEKKELSVRIARRTQAMVTAGLFNETRSLFPYRHLKPLHTVGYSEIFEFFEGKCSKLEAIENIRKNTLKYATKQMTWFKRDKDIKWYHPVDENGIIGFLKSHNLNISYQEVRK